MKIQWNDRARVALETDQIYNNKTKNINQFKSHCSKYSNAKKKELKTMQWVFNHFLINSILFTF